MAFPSIDLGRFVNVALIKEPLNWGIVFVFATLTLLAMHVIMQAFGAMQSTRPQAAFGGPGQIAILSGGSDAFALPGTLAGSVVPNDLSRFFGAGVSPWTDGIESKYAEDGWVANP